MFFPTIHLTLTDGLLDLFLDQRERDCLEQSTL